MKIAIPYPLSSADKNFWSDLGEVIVGEYFLDHPEEFDLVAFAGGEDVSPSLYGHKNLRSSCSRYRDEFEKGCFDTAQAYSIPMVGICRGLQILNVLLGGTMVQDLGPYGGHGRTKVQTIDGQEFLVASSHHQMVVPPEEAEILAWNANRIDDLSRLTYGDGLTDLEHLRDEQGQMRIVQAVAWPKEKVFATQWHSEWMSPDSSGRLWAIKQVEKYCLTKEDLCVQA